MESPVYELISLVLMFGALAALLPLARQVLRREKKDDPDRKDN